MKIHEYNQMMAYLTRQEPPSLPPVASGEQRETFAEGSISSEQKEIAKKMYGKNFEELTPNQKYKIRKGDLKPGSISFEQYLEDYKNMTNDSNYKPEYIKPATSAGLSAEQRRARTQAAQSIEGFEEKLLKNINKNKKQKRNLDP